MPSSLRRIFGQAALLLCLCVGIPAFAGDSWTPFVAIPEAASWEEGAYVGEFLTIDGRSRPESACHVWLWTREGSFRMHLEVSEPRMASLRMEKSARDSEVWSDDNFDIHLRRGGQVYHVIFNALGTLLDEKNEDSAWNGGWTVSTARELYRWTADLSIPFAELGGVPAAGEEWGLQMGASRSTNRETEAWVPDPENLRYKNAWGTVRFETLPRPVKRVAGSENDASPAYVWSDGVAREGVRCETLPAGTEYLCHRFDFRDDQGALLYSCNWVLRASQVWRILEESVEALEKCPDISVEEKTLAHQARQMSKLTCDDTPELYSLLEEEACALRNRILYRLRLRQMAAAGFPKDSLAYGIQAALVRQLPPDSYRGTIGGALELDAARGEQEAGQVTLFAGESPLMLAEAKLEAPLASDSGDSIPAEAVTLRREGYVTTCLPEYRTDYVGSYPDPLMPLSPFDVAAFGQETLWVSVRVPRDAAPGLYQGALVLQAKNALPTRVPVALRVRPFAIPEKSSLVSAFGVWQSPQYGLDFQKACEMILEHRLTPYAVANPPDDSLYPKLLRKPYIPLQAGDVLELLLNSQEPGTLAVTVESASGVTARREFPVTPGENRFLWEEYLPETPEDGLYRVAATLRNAPEARLSMLRRRGLNGLTVFGLTPFTYSAVEMDGDTVEQWPSWEFLALDPPAVPPQVDWTEFDEGFQWGLAHGITSHVARIEEPRGLWARIFRDHLREKGWEKYFYTYLADEPTPAHYPEVNRRLSQAKDMKDGVSLKNMMTARSFPEELLFVDIWCPEIHTYDPIAAAQEQSRGRNVWWYVAYGSRRPFPNVWIDSPLTEGRVWLWMTWKHKLDGILYWSVNWWGWANPWFGGGNFNNLSNGDGNLVYPDPSGTPLSSIRLETLQDGLEDYELFCLLEAARDEIGDRNPALAERIHALLEVNPAVVVSWKEYSRDPQVLLAERVRLMDCLEEAVAFLGHDPVITRHPVRRPGLSPKELAGGLARFRQQEESRGHKNAEKFRSLQGKWKNSPQILLE